MESSAAMDLAKEVLLSCGIILSSGVACAFLAQKMKIPDAFHAAQKELRDFGFDPYQWAGFILIE